MLIGLFDHIAATSLPVVHKKFVVVNRWGKGAGEFTEQVRIVHTETGDMVTQSNKVKFSLVNMDVLHNVISNFTNVKFPHEGKYWVEILLDNELARSFNFYIRKLKKPSST